MSTLHACEAAGMCSEIVELRELRMLARSRAPGLPEFLRAFLFHRRIDGCRRGRTALVQIRPSRLPALPPGSLVRLIFQCARRAQARDCG